MTTSAKSNHLKRWPGSPAREKNPISQRSVPFPEYTSSARDEIAVAWIGSELEFSLIRKGEVQFSYHAERPAADVEQFVLQLKEFIDDLSFKGKNLSILSENNLVKTITETLPPVSVPEQKQYIRAKIHRLERDVGPILWEPEVIESARSNQKRLLHTISKADLDELVNRLSQIEINLERLVPLSSVANQHLFIRSKFRDTPTIISTTIAGSLKLLASNHKGELIFTRGLSSDVSSYDRKTSIEINRCLLFAKQQYGLEITKVELDSKDSDSLTEAIRATCGDQIEISKEGIGKRFWPQAISSCKTGNLLHLREARSHSQIAISFIAGCMYLILAYMAYDAYLDSQNQMIGATTRIENLKHSRSLLQENLEKATHRINQASEAETLINASAQFSKPPINLALIQFLGQRLPEKMRISGLETTWSESESQWTFALQLKSSYTKPQTSRFGRQIRDWLKEPPFSAEISSSFHESNNIVSVINGSTDLQEHTYNINGRIQHGI